MSDAVEEYKAAVYTAVGFYGIESQDGPWENLPSTSVPLIILDPDVAPYMTITNMHDLSACLLDALAGPLGDEARRAVEKVLAWTDEVESPYVAYQREPLALAGKLTADIETDPNCPD